MWPSKIIFISFVGFFLAPLSYADGIFWVDRSDFSPASLVRSSMDFGNGSPKIALYNDEGTWSTGYDHLRLFLAEYQVSFTVIDRHDVRGGKLTRDKFDVLIMPGGASWTYLATLEEIGAKAIRSFVDAGGGYLGICAGAFYAMSHREGGYHTGKYGIDLVIGRAHDGTNLGTSPFIDGMVDFDIHYPAMPQSMRIVLLEGPSILVEAKEAARIGLRIVAGFRGGDHPAMTLSNYGAGRVFLSGPHPEVEENRTGWGSAYFDPESDWPLLFAMLEEIIPD